MSEEWELPKGCKGVKKYHLQECFSVEVGSMHSASSFRVARRPGSKQWHWICSCVHNFFEIFVVLRWEVNCFMSNQGLWSSYRLFGCDAQRKPQKGLSVTTASFQKFCGPRSAGLLKMCNLQASWYHRMSCDSWFSTYRLLSEWSCGGTGLFCCYFYHDKLSH